MSKLCTKCKSILPESEFNWKFKDIKLSNHCKDCSRKYVKSHYLNNTKYYLDKARKRNQMVKERAFSYIGPYLLAHPCVDCGESDILVLEFDHRERSLKEGEIRRIIQKGGALETVIREISKCDVRCANCHRRKTAKESISWKLKYAPVA